MSRIFSRQRQPVGKGSRQAFVVAKLKINFKLHIGLKVFDEALTIDQSYGTNHI